MLPRPDLSFTLPSIYDDTGLDCRIYHPVRQEERWNTLHAAIIAHPYAPLGGCYDDPVVLLIGGILLQTGFVVVTFNFRGASSSDGRTSWSSKPERADYMSVVGFVVYYMHYLHSPQRLPQTTAGGRSPTLLFAGYSYGAMVTTQLPSLQSVLSQFASPATHTAFADIRLRAQYLAGQVAGASAAASPRRSQRVRVGGDEDRSFLQHPHDNLRTGLSRQEIRGGVKDLLSKATLAYMKIDCNSATQYKDRAREESRLEKVHDLIRYHSAYLVVSPPLGIATNLATMSFPLSFSMWPMRKRSRIHPGGNDKTTKEQEATEAEDKLIANPVVVIYGNRDIFLSMRRIQDWTNRLCNVEGSNFHHIMIPGAGHFWAEDGVISKLSQAINSFASRLTQNQNH
ncbi:Alpha/Beta hydrolase protein [Durotheca rogersii]|uniref:Alpha/Beta hydrolase protein n=1 Tax=Durotheca rogersii TaxID=419775 RepID=UPI0022207666|nr:Alpha/Beta hydrolase protein [Durotheca rogersii]KAI5851760.1 Alpha/Beta hydrolase protein [Durotheca rogersii]